MAFSIRNKACPFVAAAVALALSGCQTMPTGPAVGSRDTSDDAVKEVVGVQELRREVAELRDAVEVQRNELDKLRERQRQLYDDLDYRLRQSEGGAGTAASGGTPRQQSYGSSREQSGAAVQQEQAGSGQGQATDDDQIYGQQGIAEPDAEQQSGQSAAPSTDTSAQQQSAAARQPAQTGGAPSTQMSVASAEEQAAYDSAFELLKQSRYNDAIIEFRSMVSEFPNGALVDDAQYWIGEAYYVTRDFENALNAFQTVVNRYPDSQRVPEAMLKLGYVQAELGRNEEARQTLNQVISQYPGSRVAISAETRLSKLR
ncbi:MAG TPA: tol-pal system protein YbgF [Arenicellales bacterium]|nr:tol-pal system protein YbgF [Arenicellales bacterium]